MEVETGRKNILLGDFLVEQGLIDEQQLREALKYHYEKGVQLGQSLIDLGYINETQMIKALSEQLGVQYVKLSTYKEDPAVIDLIPAEMAWNYHVFPLFRIRDRLTVAMVNPLDIFAIDALTRATKMKIEPVVSADSEIIAALEKHYPQNGITASATERAIKPSAGGNEIQVVQSGGQRENLLHQIDQFLTKLIRKQARQVWLVGDRLKVAYARGQDLWEIPGEIERRAFIRMLCNLGDDTHTSERDPQRCTIERTLDGRTTRFHILTSANLNADLLAITVQIEKRAPENDLQQMPMLEKLKAAMAERPGVSLVLAPTPAALDSIYYTLWEAMLPVADYPISLENQPTSYYPESVQINCSHPADQLALLRYASGAGADALFLKNIDEPAFLQHAAHFATFQKAVVIGLSAPEPWNLQKFLPVAGNEAGWLQQLSRICIYSPLRKLCAACRKKAEGLSVQEEATIAYLEITPFVPGGCPQCQECGYTSEMPFAFLWQAPDDAESLNAAEMLQKFKQALEADAKERLLPLLQETAVSWRDVGAIFR